MGFLSGTVPRQSKCMNAATPFPWSDLAAGDNANSPIQETQLQAQRWEAVGRLAGGVVHDFNNLLTGVMLYCDLLLSSLDARDRRRRYAEEIRSAIVQATGLVKQLLVFARPQATPVGTLCLNEIARGMHDLLARLIGENIALDLHLDPELGAVTIDQAHAQQVLLNLVLNARDAPMSAIVASHVQLNEHDSTHHPFGTRPRVRCHCERRHRRGNPLGGRSAASGSPASRTDLFSRRNRPIPFRE